MKQIPLTPSQNSTFDGDVDGRRYTFRFTYNSRAGYWAIDLSLAGVAVVNGAVAAIGVELFQGDATPEIPRGLYMVPTDQETRDAAFDELGLRVVLLQITAEDGLNVPTVQ